MHCPCTAHAPHHGCTCAAPALHLRCTCAAPCPAQEKFPLLSTDPFPSYDDEGNELDQDHGPFSAVYEHGCGHLDSSTCLTDLHKVSQCVSR